MRTMLVIAIYGVSVCCTHLVFGFISAWYSRQFATDWLLTIALGTLYILAGFLASMRLKQGGWMVGSLVGMSAVMSLLLLQLILTVLYMPPDAVITTLLREPDKLRIVGDVYYSVFIIWLRFMLSTSPIVIPLAALGGYIGDKLKRTPYA